MEQKVKVVAEEIQFSEKFKCVNFALIEGKWRIIVGNVIDDEEFKSVDECNKFVNDNINIVIDLVYGYFMLKMNEMNEK